MPIKWTIRATMVALACALLLMPTAARGKPAEAEKPAPRPWDARDKATLEAWQGVLTARAESDKIRAATRGLIQKTETEAGKIAARRVVRESYRATGEMIDSATDEFLAAFAASDLNDWDLKADAELLEAGLGKLAQKTLKQDPQRALELWEILIEKLPGCNSARSVRTTWLPIALPSAGDLNHAEKRLRQLLAEADEMDQPILHVAIGDTLALKGDFEGAQNEYAAAVKDIPPDKELTQYDRRKRARRYANLRAAHIGKPAPEIDTPHWLGAKAQPLSALRGTVLILDYWATW